MSKTFNKYVSSLNELTKIRQKHNDKESKEEDKLLDKMDVLWWKLTENERALMNRKELDKTISIKFKNDQAIFLKALAKRNCTTVSAYIKKTMIQKLLEENYIKEKDIETLT